MMNQRCNSIDSQDTHCENADVMNSANRIVRFFQLVNTKSKSGKNANSRR
jgi:hypothetical protein